MPQKYHQITSTTEYQVRPAAPPLRSDLKRLREDKVTENQLLDPKQKRGNRKGIALKDLMGKAITSMGLKDAR
jgi:hypothetical protein